MSETMIKNRNLPNPHLFEPFFCTRACHHPSPYYYFIFEAMGKPTWSTEQKSIVQALINLSNDDFYRLRFSTYSLTLEGEFEEI
jgi:hypothetical protein